MRNTRNVWTIAALTLLGLVACKSEEKPDAFIQATIKAVDGQPQAMWNALPASYQKDVNEVLAQFAGKMHPQIWNDGFALAQKVVTVLEKKKDFILAHPTVAQLVKKEDVDTGWEPTVRILSRVVHSELKTLDGVRGLNVEKFLASTIAEVMDDVEKAGAMAAKAAPVRGAPNVGDLRAKLKTAKVTVESIEGDSAKVKIEVEGEKPDVQEMVKVEGKWIPKELADGWQQGVADAKKSIDGLKIEPAMVTQFAGMKAMADTILDGLLAAPSQDAFNAQVAAALEAMGMGKKGPPTAQAGPAKSVKAKKRGRR